jgi:hypothetical protein
MPHRGVNTVNGRLAMTMSQRITFDPETLAGFGISEREVEEQKSARAAAHQRAVDEARRQNAIATHARVIDWFQDSIAEETMLRDDERFPCFSEEALELLRQKIGYWFGLEERDPGFKVPSDVLKRMRAKFAEECKLANLGHLVPRSKEPKRSARPPQRRAVEEINAVLDEAKYDYDMRVSALRAQFTIWFEGHFATQQVRRNGRMQRRFSKETCTKMQRLIDQWFFGDGKPPTELTEAENELHQEFAAVCRKVGYPELVEQSGHPDAERKA